MSCKWWSKSFSGCYALIYWTNDTIGYSACDGDIDKCPTVKVVMEAIK